MTYEEAIEAMALAMCKKFFQYSDAHCKGRFLKEARAAAEAIGLREIISALEQSQKALAMLTAPEAIRSTSVSGAWAAAVAAECAARRALSPAP